MASDTPLSTRDLILYSVYLRAHTPEGTFRALIPDLDRIRALGADVIWLMPIHPIGVQGKKGSLGCPYANRDYRSVNPEYGTLEDFRALVEAIHRRDMRCIIDVVYNHTSPDAVLTKEHPEFYYRRSDGSFGNKTADWTDVIDLDYSCAALWDYQIESLRYWAGIVDGFRCDVASLIPAAFWRRARAAVAEVRPDCLWLAESVHSSFNVFNRMHGVPAATDSELFTAFDMEYDYDIRDSFDAFLDGRDTLSHYLDMLNFQEAIYPDNYTKLRCLENHDQRRIADRAPGEKELENLTAFLYFLKGAALLYAGQEFACTHTPSLFEKEVFPRDTGRDLSSLLRTLGRIKKEVLSSADWFHGTADDKRQIAVLERTDGQTKKLGVFSLRGRSGTVKVPLPDGEYKNLLTGRGVQIKNGVLHCGGRPIVLTAPEIESCKRR